MTTANTVAATLAPESLQRLCQRAFLEAGVPSESAAFMGWALVETDLRGIDSHGVTRLRQQLDGIRSGAFNASGIPRVEREFGSIVQIDGDGVMGHIAARAAMLKAIEVASVHGVGIVTVSNSNPFGSAFLYSSIAAADDKIGFITTNGPAVMPVHGGLQRSICNNPLSWAIPTHEQPAIVLDMACMVAARGRISLAAREHRPIPPGWALDAAGNPTVDPVEALAGHLLPVGGPKGSGLAVINELIAGALTGARMLDEIPDGVVATGDFREPMRLGHFVMVIDPQAWMPVTEFKDRIELARKKLRAARRADPGTPILLPGEPEYLTKLRRTVDGIALGTDTMQSLRDIDLWGILD